MNKLYIMWVKLKNNNEKKIKDVNKWRNIPQFTAWKA